MDTRNVASNTLLFGFKTILAKDLSNSVRYGTKNICMSSNSQLHPTQRLTDSLLLHGFFHAAGFFHQFYVAKNLRLFARDTAFDRCVGQQLDQVAFGHRQVAQV